jgi:hypothetical protein
VLNLFRRAGAAGGIPRGTTDGKSHVEGVPDELAIEIDSDGSPVSFPAAQWFVCFVPGLQRQWWHRFAPAKYQHVFVMRMVGDDHWILVEPWWTRMLVSVLSLDEAVKFLRWGAAGNILQVREAIPGCGNQARGWSNCAVLTSFLLGRSYWTWTPRGLYRRLAAEPGARPVDLAQWLADHVRSVASRTADRVAAALEANAGKPLRTVLLHVGDAVMTALMSRPGLALYKVAVSEASRFGDAATAYWDHAPRRAVAIVCKVLQEATLHREISIDDPARAARQFVAMLRGDIHLEILLGLRSSPDPTEINARVTSAVDVLLNGVTAENPSIPQRKSQHACGEAPDIVSHRERSLQGAERP